MKKITYSKNKINTDKLIEIYYQGRQTRQNSGGVADLKKGVLQNIFNFCAIKISTF